MTPHGGTPTDPPRDEHLLAALRHAPDHALTPPSHVAQAILAAAEQVHRAPAPAAVVPATARAQPERQVSLAERLQALLAPRWAGSVAAGLVAALVVGLWYEEDLPAPVNNDRVAAQTQSESRPTPASTAPSAPSPSAAPTVTQDPAPALPQTAARPPTAAPATTARSAVAEAPVAKASRNDAARRMAETPTPTIGEAAAPPTAAPAAPVQAMPPSPAPVGPVAPDRPATPRDDARAEAVAPGSADARRRAPSAAAPPATSTSVSGSSAPPVEASRLAAAPGANVSGVAAASPALTLLRRARADADTRSAIWTWQTATATTARSFDAEAQDWLQRLVYDARGRWVDVAERSDGGPATELRWWRNDEAVASLRIEAQGLRWTEPSGRIRYAPMTADELNRLRPP